MKIFTPYFAADPSNDEDWMKIAYNAALEAMQAGEVPIGAVIIRENKLLTVAHNQVIGGTSVLGHSELLAMHRAAAIIGDWRLNDCTLYVTKEPCPMCSGACVMGRIGRVVFAVGDPKMGCLGGSGLDFSQQNRFNHTFPCTSGVLEEPCRELLQEFFRIRRQKQSKHEKKFTAKVFPDNPRLQRHSECADQPPARRSDE
jgi:tRNA(adenine34) deaminase